MQLDESTAGSHRLPKGSDQTGQGSHLAADINDLSIGADHAFQYEPSLSQGPVGTNDHLGEDVDDEAWEQISGPSDDEMSCSDESSIHSVTQYQTPKTILDVEQNNAQSDLPTISEVHSRYKDFASLLCKETATEDTHQHVLEGLPVAVATAKSIPLDELTARDDKCDIYGIGLVIHVWQIVCFRMQCGTLPPAELDVSLCLSLTAYFLSAHAIIENFNPISPEELQGAVQYWEARLKLKGQGNKWMEDGWAHTIPDVDQDRITYRNETADAYMEALYMYGKEGVAHTIIETEKKGDRTQLRTMIESSPDGLKEARRQLASMLYSMDTSLLKAMIQGQLPRLAMTGSGPVFQALKVLNEKEYLQPGTYMNCICDHFGLSPTPAQWQRVCEQMLKYVQSGNEHNDLAQQIDQRVHPKHDWPKDLAHKGLRRYTEWRSYTEKGSHDPDVIHRRWVKYFVDQLRKRMEGHLIHAPLNVPVVEIGFSNNPERRLRQHRHHESSNYLMNLAEAAFAMEYPGSFTLQQNIVFACYRPIQTWLSEIVVTQLAQGYVEGGSGFSHEPAGRSNTSSNKTVPPKMWVQFEAQIYLDGRFEREVDENNQRVLAKRKARIEEAEKRKKLREAKRKLHEQRVLHLKNMIALEKARKNLYDALRRRLQ